MACTQAQDYASGTGRLKEALRVASCGPGAPERPRTNCSCGARRRCGSLSVIVGYADDYAWFTGLVRRLFPDEAEAALSAPDVRTRVERFARLFAERHFPLYLPVIEYWMEWEGDEPPWSWLRTGIPFHLMGFGYEGVHELWNGYRDGISALLLLGQPPGLLLRGVRRDTDGLAGVGRRAHPASDPGANPPGRHTGRDPRRGGEGHEVRGGRPRPPPGSSPRRATSSSTPAMRTGPTTVSADPWDDDIIKEGTEEWRKASALMDSVCTLADWLEDDLPGPFRRDAGRRPAQGLRTTTRTTKGGRRP